VKTSAPRTSTTDPLKIASLALGTHGGRLGVTLCPGKHAPSLLAGPPWARDLSADVQAIKAWGAAAVLTLLEPEELLALQVADLGAVVRSAGMVWHHQPICDGQAPDASFMRQWPALRSDLLAVLQQGGSVLVHCRGGLGRAGTVAVAALLAIETGMAPAAAIAAIRAVRPGAIETAVQEAFVMAYKPAPLS
jgi:protein-tyrosine phosphatase